MDVPEALFELDGDRFLPTEFTRGPWRPDAQHGGPPSALLAHNTELLLDDGEFIAHIEVELVRPVPLAPLTASSERERVSRRASRIRAELHSDSEMVARSTALVLAGSELPNPDWTGPSLEPIDPPGRDREVEAPRWATGRLTTYHRNAVEHRFVAGSFAEAGPAVDWIRLRQPVVTDVAPSGLVRAMAAADFGSGISSVFSPQSNFGMINANLSVSFAREPMGEWISAGASIALGPQGTGLCITRLGDYEGSFGVGSQALLGYSMRAD